MKKCREDVDTGIYNKDNELYAKLVKQLYAKFPGGVTFPPEYGDFVQNNLTQLLIRLARYKFVSRMLKKSDSVLEIGSGSGLGSILLGQHCSFITGIDVKQTEVEEARSINRRENVEFKVGDFFKMNLEKKYDAVIAMDVIEHMPEEKGNELVRLMATNLKKSGMIIIGTPSLYSYPYQGKLSQASHVKCYDLDELVTMVEKYFLRTLTFSMNDEVVHTGYHKMAWYYFVLAFYPINF